MALTSENAAGAGTETGDAIKITAGAGVELINLPENGYTLSGARIRYTYDGKTYLTEPVTSSINITSASDGTEVADDEYFKISVCIYRKRRTSDRDGGADIFQRIRRRYNLGAAQ